MKLKFLFSMCAILFMTGCSSKVVTYDAKGQIIGSCKATRGLLSTASAQCYGSANAFGVDYNQLDGSGLLPLPPSSTQISLKR